MRGRFGLALVACLVGCAHSSTAAPRSVSDVKRAFAHHGIKLSEDGAGVLHLPYRALSGQSAGVTLNVDVYPANAHRGRVVLFLGNGPPHFAAARNVELSWTGADNSAARAAMDDLR